MNTNFHSGTSLNATKNVSLGINVCECGAVGDGKADDTVAFKNACLIAERENLFVMVPDGLYRLTSSITLNDSVIHGYSVQNWPQDKEKLPTIILDHQENGFLLFSAGISGLHFTRTQGTDKPVIRINFTGCRVSNVYISDVDTGICFKDFQDEPDPGSNPGRSNLENIYIEDCTRLGMYISGTLDVPFVKNIYVVSNKEEFAQSGVGIRLTQNDDIRMSDCMVRNAAIAYQITDTNQYIEQALWGSLDNCSAENCKVGIQVESGVNMQSRLCAPVTFTGGTINSIETALKINKSRVQYAFYDTTLRSVNDSTLKIEGGEGVLLTNCNIFSDKSDTSAVTVEGCRGFIMSGCTVKSQGDGIVLHENNTSAVIADNTVIVPNRQVISCMKENVIIKGNGN
jgi:hypothetical protein